MSKKIKVIQTLKLETIANSASATKGEMLDALIVWAYGQPHATWNQIIDDYRKSVEGYQRGVNP